MNLWKRIKKWLIEHDIIMLSAADYFSDMYLEIERKNDKELFEKERNLWIGKRENTEGAE